jgi:hypothetical protein
MVSHARYVDARGGTFTNVGRDQHNINIYQTIHVDGLVSSVTADQTLHYAMPSAGHASHSSTLSSEALTPKRALMRPHHSEVGSAGAIAASLIGKIEELLVDRTETTDNDRELKDELELLRQTLTLTRLGIQTFEYTPLGRNLAESINPELERCCVLLQQLFDSFDSCRQGLFPTFIWHLWRYVWWSGCEMDGRASLRTQLSAHRILLGGCLMALNS